MAVMTAQQFIERLKFAESNKTHYVHGCFGADLTDAHKKRYINNGSSYNKKNAKKIQGYESDSFGFDCCGLIKGILWGWNAELGANYGGAKYESNGVSDATIQTMMKGYSTDFSTIVEGEFVATEDWGHIGVYIGDGQVIECTASFSVNVCRSNCENVGGSGAKYSRSWYCHVKSGWIDYSTSVESAPEVASSQVATDYMVGDKVRVDGVYKSANATKKYTSLKYYEGTITQIAGGKKHPYLIDDGGLGWCGVEDIKQAAQPIAQPVAQTSTPKHVAYDVDAIAREVINGKWGNGAVRKVRLAAAGYDYKIVQARVNELCK